MVVAVTEATGTDAAALADVAARTFGLACPPSSTPDNIAKFIAANLSAARFAEYLADPDRVLLAAHPDAPAGPIIGYAMLIPGLGDDGDVRRAVTLRPAAELSKMYVLPEHHGGGTAAALIDEALARAGELGAKCVWLGVNQHNARAQRFYAKHGFAVHGSKTFRVGDHVENDYVMVRPL